MDYLLEFAALQKEKGCVGIFLNHPFIFCIIYWCEGGVIDKVIFYDIFYHLSGLFFPHAQDVK